MNTKLSTASLWGRDLNSGLLNVKYKFCWYILFHHKNIASQFLQPLEQHSKYS
jgi:hypothetical protein